MGYIKDGLWLHIYWWGIYFGIFYMPAVALAHGGILLFVFPFYGSVFTGLVVFVLDPVRRWYGSLGIAVVIRFLVSTLTTALLIAFDTVTFGDLKETAILVSIPWVLYVIALVVVYFRHKQNKQPSSD